MELDATTASVVLAVVLVVVSIVLMMYFSQGSKRASEEEIIKSFEQPIGLDTSGKSPLGDGSVGEADKYQWSQTETEMEVLIPLEADKFNPPLQPKEIDVQIQAETLVVTVRKKKYIVGKFFRPVKATESYWLIDKEPADDMLRKIKASGGMGKGSKKKWGKGSLALMLFLIKRTTEEEAMKASDKGFWRSLLQGDPEVYVPGSVPS